MIITFRHLLIHLALLVCFIVVIVAVVVILSFVFLFEEKAFALVYSARIFF